MEKQTEIEQIINNKATSLTLVFYEVALLIYSIYMFITTGELGIPFIIFMAGLIIYFASNMLYKRKIK